ncbi:XkdX family protein [Lactobacillus johnsonii]|uniref:XkdX family protein n=1 Tax=Lactobacillus johnsonii TaxID=33959 RepID=UPI003D071906
MFDTILDNLNTIQNEMVAMFKQQYEWGWFGKTKEESNLVLRGYVSANALTPEGYKKITGEEYDKTETVSTQSQNQ